MKLRSLLIVLFSLLTVGQAQAQLFGKKKEAVPEYKQDASGNVVVAKVLEDINLSQQQIYALCHDYLAEAYQETKYTFVAEQPDMGIVAGKGRYENFYVNNGLRYSYQLCCDFVLRVDIKEGRLRISAMANTYSGQEMDVNVNHKLEDKIVTVRPIVDDNMDVPDERERIYAKAFPELLIRLSKTADTFAAYIREKASVLATDDW